MSESSTTLLRFLVEFRQRLIRSLFALAVIFLVCCILQMIFIRDCAALVTHLPHGQGLIATQVVAPFFVPFKLTLVAAAFVAIPIFLYQLWAFIAPALYQHEKHKVWPLLVASTLLFYGGVAFAYFVIFPIVFTFFTQAAPRGVTVSPDISQYLDFALQLLWVFGLTFEVPVVTILLVWTGLVKRETLIRIRPYAIVGGIYHGMLFAPPDVLSQTLLAIPLWLLIEAGVFFASFFLPSAAASQQDREKIT